MKSFREYLSEETMPQALADKEFVGVESEAVRDNINSLLKGVTAKPFVTPYIALERVRKVLAYFHISLPAHNFMQGDYGYSVFNINQFGSKFGQTNDGNVVVKEDSPYSVYFEYQAGDDGLFDVFCELVTDDELEEILSDYDAESEDNEENEEEYSANAQQNYEINKDEHEGLKEETQLKKGRPSQRHPLEGHPYHKKSDAELLYIGKDAHKAAEAMKGHNPTAEAKYLDQANDAATVRHFRKRSGMPNWYKKKYGHDNVKEANEPFDPPFVQKGKEKVNPGRRASTISAKAEKQIKKIVRKKK
jgi:hypothetical protein